MTPEIAETESLDRWAHMRLEGTKVKRLPDDLNPSDLRDMWVRTPPRAPQLSWLYISGTRRVVPDRRPRVTSCDNFVTPSTKREAEVALRSLATGSHAGRPLLAIATRFWFLDRVARNDAVAHPRNDPGSAGAGGPAGDGDDSQHQHSGEGSVPVLGVAPGQLVGQGLRPVCGVIALPAQLGAHPPQP